MNAPPPSSHHEPLALRAGAWLIVGILHCLGSVFPWVFALVAGLGGWGLGWSASAIAGAVLVAFAVGFGVEQRFG